MLEFRQVCVGFGGRSVLRDLSLELRAGQRLGLLGPSGVGKSTLLRLAAGGLRADSGVVNNRFRHPVLVFQQARLLPWRSVLDNILIPLRAAGLPVAQAQTRALHWLERVQLRDAAGAWPGELSGGMAQRVSLARAFALQPDLLLLDEPFSALDPALRASLADVCRGCLDDSGAALLYVSHQPQELMRLADACLLLGKDSVQRFALADTADDAQRDHLAERLYRLLLNPEGISS
ncbi:ABC transporter ATP-binding protein [Alcaligenes sp. SDU_A2]|uniref:ABC transporter ATP-binding protein n=1 Tax=Alcaligenes sp. SDU_A2 TaxID=3136634 RepID=UPI00311EE2AF